MTPCLSVLFCCVSFVTHFAVDGGGLAVGKLCDLSMSMTLSVLKGIPLIQTILTHIAQKLLVNFHEI